jgi:glycosyltransferase involved in cell wall biosynthesis
VQNLIVVPCFNEAERLDRGQFARLGGAPGVRLLFVDDGSTDRTVEVLEEIRRHSANTDVLVLDRNRGKAEAVRAGMLRGTTSGATCIGYLDADLATPIEEMLRLAAEIERTNAAVVTGARVALSGYEIQRSFARHYLGRVFATLAALILRQPYYDTQCGAKLFRNTGLLAQVLSEPFHSSWAFDLELLGRLRVGTPDFPGVTEMEILEVPLRRWTDVRGSKVKPVHVVRTLVELQAIETDLRARRRLVEGAD